MKNKTKVYTWTIQIQGVGDTEEEAQSSALEGLYSDFGPFPKPDSIEDFDQDEE